MTNPILYWNFAALEANRTSHTNASDPQTLGPVLSARALAIVHLAMMDAYAKVTGDFEPYLSDHPDASADTDFNAAIAGAAHTALSTLHPSQKAFFNRQLTNAGIAGPHASESLEYGRQIALKILDDRKDDPIKPEDIFIPADGKYISSPARGHHHPDPDNASQGFYAPFYGKKANLFATKKRYELAPPPQPGTPAYQAAAQDVYEKGIKPELAGTLLNGARRRTPVETLIGLYWAYDGAFEIGTPPRQYNQIIVQVATARGLGTGECARLLALVNVAMADAGTLAWQEKYRHDFWRPVVALREHDESMGPGGKPMGRPGLTKPTDPAWLPLGSPRTNATALKNFTPNFPAYPSGHATFGAAAFHMARLFFSDGALAGNYDDDGLLADLSFVSDELNGLSRDVTPVADVPGTMRPRHVRTFPGGFWDMILENGRSRVFLGVHWQFDAFLIAGGPDAAGDGDEIDNPTGGEPVIHACDTEEPQNVGGVPLGLCIAEDIWENATVRDGSRSPSKPVELSDGLTPAQTVSQLLADAGRESLAELAEVRLSRRNAIRTLAADAGEREAAEAVKTIVARVKTADSIKLAFISTQVDVDGEDLEGTSRDQSALFQTDETGFLVWALKLLTDAPHVSWKLFLTPKGEAEGDPVASGTTNSQGKAFDPAHPDRLPGGFIQF